MSASICLRAALTLGQRLLQVKKNFIGQLLPEERRLLVVSVVLHQVLLAGFIDIVKQSLVAFGCLVELRALVSCLEVRAAELEGLLDDDVDRLDSEGAHEEGAEELQESEGLGCSLVVILLSWLDTGHLLEEVPVDEIKNSHQIIFPIRIDHLSKLVRVNELQKEPGCHL